MNRRIALGLALLGALTAGESRADWPQWMDRWLFNAEERTRRGAESLAASDYTQAAAAMDTAFRLAPDDPGAAYNAGTARLPLAPEEGRLLLDAASQSDDPQLASRAHFNSGNSLMENGDLPAAIDAFKQSLRRDPGFEDAKFNLELAQKRLREQQQENQDQQNQDQQNQDQQDQDQQNQDQQNQDQQDQEQQDQEQQDQQNQDQQNQDQQDQEQQDQEQQDQEQQDQQNQDQQNQEQQDQEQQEQQPGEQDPQGGQDQQQSPLPQFQDLPDMSAEEAAAILEAIENLERDQRRQEALEAAKANVGGKKDW